MKLILLPLLALLSGCTIIPTQHGKVHMWADYEDVSLDDGTVHFRAKKIVSSTVARTHWHGLTSVGSEAAGVIVGGKVIGAAAAVIPAMVNRPTTRPAANP